MLFVSVIGVAVKEMYLCNSLCERTFFYLFLTDNAEQTDIRDMLTEADVMKSLQPHPHIVRLIGYCIEKGIDRLHYDATCVKRSGCCNKKLAKTRRGS